MGMNRRDCLAGLIAFQGAAFAASGLSANEAVWAALQRPGALALMRHAIAPGMSDPAGFRLDDCSTQRNLDARGRDQARETGARMRMRGVLFDRVLTSQWCRCVETAELLDIGPVQTLPALNSFFENRSDGPVQTAETRRYIERLSADETAILVTHQVNITALTGRGVASGEVFVVERGGGARLDVIGDLLVR
jgi:phosphohistidine phosphatase SixA